jgi:hypothetical protein
MAMNNKLEYLEIIEKFNRHVINDKGFVAFYKDGNRDCSFPYSWKYLSG